MYSHALDSEDYLDSYETERETRKSQGTCLDDLDNRRGLQSR